MLLMNFFLKVVMPLVYDKYRSNGVWDGYVKELVQGKSPIFYIDTGGITRMNYYNKELLIVHSGEIPSKIPGKTIQDV